MEKMILLINGLHLPHETLHAAIKSALEQDCALEVLLITGDAPRDNYAYPSDLEAAQEITGRNTSLEASQSLAESQLQVIRDIMESEGVRGEVLHWEEPSIETIVEASRNARLLIMEKPDPDRPRIQSVTKFTMDEMVAKLGCEVREWSSV